MVLTPTTFLSFSYSSSPYHLRLAVERCTNKCIPFSQILTWQSIPSFPIAHLWASGTSIYLLFYFSFKIRLHSIFKERAGKNLFCVFYKALTLGKTFRMMFVGILIKTFLSLWYLKLFRISQSREYYNF